MPVTVGTSGGNKAVDFITLGTSGGNKNIIEGWVGTSGGNKQFFEGEVVALSDATVSDTVGDPANASATYTLDNNGTVTKTLTSGTTVLGSWITPNGSAGAAFECRATIVSGSVSSGTTGSWLTLDTDRSWSRTQGVLGTSTVVLTVEIRRVSTGDVLATATITIEAEVF